MKSARKNKNIIIDQNEFGILSLIKEGLLGTCTHLMNEKEVNEIIKSGKFKGESFPYPLSFAPKNAEEALNDIKSGDRIDLMLDEKVVGHIDFKSQFKNNKNFSDIFSPNTCS
nr:sulfate adenylyltransferase [Campylobacter jejuni]